MPLDHFIVKYGHLFDTKNLIKEESSPTSDMPTDYANVFLNSNFEQLKSLQKIISSKQLRKQTLFLTANEIQASFLIYNLAKKQWWGEHRIDYVLYAPEKIGNLPRKSLPYIFHSCFWESSDAVAFMLRMITKSDAQFQANEPQMTIMKMAKEPVEKWQRRLNRVKLRVGYK